MSQRLTSVRGIPRRFRTREVLRPPSLSKVDLATADLERVLPLNVRITVTGGRNATGSAMRAARVQSGLERVGAQAWTVELDASGATLHAEVDPDQLAHAATLPFVRRISLS